MTEREAGLRPNANSTESGVRIARLRDTAESFGTLIDYLARLDPFRRFELGNFALAVQYQLHRGQHVAAIKAGRLIGYCGWLETSHDLASAWVEGRAALGPSDVVGEAVAVTVVASQDPRVLRAMIRSARDGSPGRRLYFKREYAGRKEARKSSVQDYRNRGTGGAGT
jgi:hypothetical protein